MENNSMKEEILSVRQGLGNWKAGIDNVKAQMDDMEEDFS